MDKLKSILSEILKSTPNYAEKAREMEIFEVWPKAVGERISKNCWPVRLIEKDVLLVASHNSAWIYQLRFLEKQILENLTRELKDKRVRQLRFKLEMAPRF